MDRQCQDSCHKPQAAQQSLQVFRCHGIDVIVVETLCGIQNACRRSLDGLSRPGNVDVVSAHTEADVAVFVTGVGRVWPANAEVIFCIIQGLAPNHMGRTLIW